MEFDAWWMDASDGYSLQYQHGLSQALTPFGTFYKIANAYTYERDGYL